MSSTEHLFDDKYRCLPTPESHHRSNDDFYYTWDSMSGNEVDGTEEDTQGCKISMDIDRSKFF